MNLGRVLLIGVLVFRGLAFAAPASAPDNRFQMRCSDEAEDRTSFSIADSGFLTIQASSVEGQLQLEKYYERELGFSANDNFALNKVRLEVPVADAGCTHLGPYTYDCKGASVKAAIDIYGYISKNVTWGNVNLKRPVEIRNLTVKTWLQTDYSSDVIQHKIQVHARAEMILDGEVIALFLAPEFNAGAVQGDGTSCEGR
jgi:hypothetical protein